MRNQPDFGDARARMVRRQLRGRGIADQRVLRAMGEVPREAYVAPELATVAYDDGPLPIGAGQTISQAYMVAFMIEAAKVGPYDRVLDIGTGSGYAAAVLGRIAAEVYSIERIRTLYESAKERLARGGSRIHVRLGDGHAGWPDAAPFDAVLVAAASAVVPPALKHQLVIGGRLIAPVGDQACQHLVKLTRTAEEVYSEEALVPVVFVPLIEGLSAKGE